MKKFVNFMVVAILLFSCNLDKGNEPGTKPVAKALAVPMSITVVPTATVGELKVTWKSVTNNNGYEIAYKEGSNNKTLAVQKDATTATLSNLKGGTEYSVSIKTKGDGKLYLDSPYSAEIKATPKSSNTGNDPVELDCPSNFTAKATGKTGEIKCSWQPVTNASSYEIKYKKVAATGEKQTQSVEKEKTTYNFSGLEDGSEYSFSIIAKGNGTNFTDSTESDEAKATPSNGLESPKNVKAYPWNEKGAIFVVWDNVYNAGGYTVKYQVEGGSEETKDVGEDDTDILLSNLQEDKTYTISVMTKAKTGFTPSQYSESVTCKTLTVADVIVLEKITIESQDEILGRVFKDKNFENGVVMYSNPDSISFKPTDDKVLITPTFKNSVPSEIKIKAGNAMSQMELQDNKFKFTKDEEVFLEITAKNSKNLTVKYSFFGRALDGKINIISLCVNPDVGSANIKTALEEAVERYTVPEDLRNNNPFKMNVKKNTTAGYTQKFLLAMELDNVESIQSVMFDTQEAQKQTVGVANYYYKELTPDQTSGKATLTAKFTLKSGESESRTYEISMVDLDTNIDIKKVIINNTDFEVQAMPSGGLEIFVPKDYKNKTYPVKVEVAEKAKCQLYFFNSNNESNPVDQGSNLKIAGEEDRIAVDIVPEIGKGIYAWMNVQIYIIVGAKKAPELAQVHTMKIGDTSIKTGVSKETAVQIDPTKVVEDFVIAFKSGEDNQYKIDDGVFFCTKAKYDEFLKLSPRYRLTSEIAPPEEGDFTAEGSEFVIILPNAVSEKYENAIYNVWLKK